MIGVLGRQLRSSRKELAWAWSAGGLATLLLAWTAVTARHIVPPDFLPTPLDVARTFVAEATTQMFSGAVLQVHALASLQKFGISYLLAIILGVPLGAAMGRFRALDWLISPVFDAIRFIPPIGWVPFSILWFGTGMLAPTWIVFVAAFPPCVINTYVGIRLVDPVLIEAARTMGANPLTLFREVFVPGALPQIVAGMRIGAGLGWQSLVGAELIVGGTGLGYAMTQSQQSLDTSTLIVCMITIGAIGTAIDYVLTWIQRHIRRRWSAT